MTEETENVYLFVPNIIGYIRIVLAIISFYFMPINHVVSSWCYIVSGMLDALDGHAARYFNQSTKFGAMLDQLTDRCGLMCLCATLSFFYPKYMFFFQISMAIDISCHWLFLHTSLLQGKTSHKFIDLSENPVMHIYYTSRPTLFCMCLGNEAFYATLYLLYFTDGPIKVTNMCVSADSKYLFTIAKDDTSVLMWNINASAVDILSHVGGLGLDPYYCLLEGGFHGWLFQEIKDLFYYAQIRHQGEHVVSTRGVSHELPLCEVPDLFRAIGYYPTMYEVEEIIHEVLSESCNDDSRETSLSQMNIDFETFVRLYINHRPALGISLDDISNAFNTAMTLSGGVTHLSDGSRGDFLHILYSTGEPITPEDCNGYLGVLLGLIKSELMDETRTAEDLLPQEIILLPPLGAVHKRNVTLGYILNDILGGNDWEEGKNRKDAVPINVPR